MWSGKIGKLEKGQFKDEENKHERFVGTPGMRSIADNIAENVAVLKSTRITGLARKSSKWILSKDFASERAFDIVIIAVPPAQAAALLDENNELQNQCAAVEMGPCWATMVAFEDGTLGFAWSGRMVDEPTGERKRRCHRHDGGRFFSCHQSRIRVTRLREKSSVALCHSTRY